MKVSLIITHLKAVLFKSDNRLYLEQKFFNNNKMPIFWTLHYEVSNSYDEH
jgi:hypothetical protein